MAEALSIMPINKFIPMNYLRVVFIFTLIVMFIIVFKVFYIQVFEYNKLNKLDPLTALKQ